MLRSSILLSSASIFVGQVDAFLFLNNMGQKDDSAVPTTTPTDTVPEDALGSFQFRYPYTGNLPPNFNLGYCVNLKDLNWLNLEDSNDASNVQGHGAQQIFAQTPKATYDLGAAVTEEKVKATNNTEDSTQAFGGGLTVPIPIHAITITPGVNFKHTEKTQEYDFRAAFWMYSNVLEEKIENFHFTKKDMVNGESNCT